MSNIWKDRIFLPQNEQGAFEYFDKQFRFDYVTEKIPWAGKGEFLASDIG